MAGLVLAYLAAAALMLVGTVTSRIWPLPNLRSVNREPAAYWPQLHLAREPDPWVGPVLVTVQYTVRPERMRQFLAAMDLVRGARQRPVRCAGVVPAGRDDGPVRRGLSGAVLGRAPAPARRAVDRRGPRGRGAGRS
ncbi:MFS transporter [Micromonospora sp. M12]